MSDPIHKRKDGWWYFWDETWADIYGPYLSRKEALKKLNEYVKLYLSDRKNPEKEEENNVKNPEI
jgi:hypothetical protein